MFRYLCSGINAGAMKGIAAISFEASGCGPTTLSMVVVYLTHNRDASPLAVAKYSEGSRLQCGWFRKFMDAYK